MAEEYIADVIRQGAKAIEAWRKKHPSAPIMLVGLDLSKINLVGANLSGANVTGCNLHMALLIGTNLSGAKLSDAKLRGANMVGADLSSADLSNAVLTGALLQRANLQGANLSGANLRRADVRGAILRGANFNGADLAGVVMTDAEKTLIEGGAEAPTESDNAASSRAALDTTGFTLQLGSGVSAIDLARLLKALDDVHVLIGLSPVLVIRLIMVSAQSGGDPAGNCLVVRLDGKASAWLQDALGANILALSSPQARILRYKKLGLSEEDVWHNVRPLLESGDDALAVLREMFQKNIILSFGVAVPTEAPGEPAPAAPPSPVAPARPAAPMPPPAPAPPPPADLAPELKACIDQLESREWGERSAAAEKLGNLGPAARAAMPYLMMAAEDENFFVREAAEEAIRKITGQG
ncbi:MAG: pentapeptide repeat-containing protein [Planctomycetota bacterium]